MATAREKLIKELLTIISQPYNTSGHHSLIHLLKSYRVQSKTGIDSSKTARNELFDQLLNTWQKNLLITENSISDILSSFRMQIKQNEHKNIETKLKNKDDNNQKNINKKDNKNSHENAYFKDKYDINNPINSLAIAGGPKQKQHQRGQCPKCRSFGIVLSRVYASENYHSCIYCGYQSYLTDDDRSLDLPLAAKLLQNLKEPNNDNED